MANTPGQRTRQSKINFRWLPELDRLLLIGMNQGPAAKQDAIDKVLQLVPELTRGKCWQRIRHLRRVAGRAAREARRHEKAKKPVRTDPVRRPPTRPWTTADDDELLTWAGREPVAKIARRLGRSVHAVRFRLRAHSMSAKVTDGWSLEELRKMLRVSRTHHLRRLIGNGMLRVRDPRVTISSLAAFCDKNGPSFQPSAVMKVTAALVRGVEGFTWERTADLLGVTVAQVQSWISAGQLRVVDPFVTDRSFEEFCKKHGDQLNTARIDSATAKWLVSEYGLPNPGGKGQSLSGPQKHALVVRTCTCQREIAGNAYFKHVKRCGALKQEAQSKAG